MRSISDLVLVLCPFDRVGQAVEEVIDLLLVVTTPRVVEPLVVDVASTEFHPQQYPIRSPLGAGIIGR